MFKHVIWDFDGTLFDTYPSINKAFESVLKRQYNCACDYNEIKALTIIDTGHCAKILSEQIGCDWKELLNEVRLEYDKINVSIQKPFTSVQEILEIILNRGQNFILTHRDKKSTFELLDKFNYVNYFQQVLTIEDGFRRKPSPDGMLRIIEENSLEKAEVISIGDRSIDIIAAKEAGLTSCYFNTQNEKCSEADYNIQCISELSKILTNSNLPSWQI